MCDGSVSTTVRVVSSADAEQAHGASETGDAEPGLTIEQLAQRTGMSVRNIRNHQSRGLLPPPEVRARIGYYAQEHVDRLLLVREMQDEGYNLKAIERLLSSTGAAADRVLGLGRAVHQPFAEEQPEVLTAADLAARFGGPDAKAQRKAEKLGMLRPLGGDRFEAPSPSLLRAAEEVVGLGVPLESALDAIERVQRHTESVSRAFIALFVEGVWKPFDEAGRPEDQWGHVTEAVERLRPLAADALLATFNQTMTGEVDAAFGKLLGRDDGKDGRRR